MARQVSILGAGLVGSLLAIILKKRGHDVTIYERRPDMRKNTISAGKSINLAVSERAWKALEIAGLKEEILSIGIPMYGRYLHQPDGSTAFQQYSKNREAIYSVSRGELNKKLMTLAEQYGVNIQFDHKCTHVNVQENVLHFQLPNHLEKSVKADLLFGADGAFSALRDSMMHMDRVSYSANYIDYGYKELCIPPLANGEMQMEKNALHIWPRGNYMLIALPNTDGTFTCTLFLPFEGPNSFETLTTQEAVDAFFDKNFADAKAMMPTMMEDFFTNPTSSLAIFRIFPWHYADKSALIGDAAHGIVPFYGQGMNAGFEDCSVLVSLMDQYGEDWATVLKQYEIKRKPNGDAVGDLAMINFVEMRDKVADAAFLERKKIEKELGKRYPEKFVSVYEMVSFSHIPYNTALRCMQAQDELLQKIQKEGNFFELINNNDFERSLHQWVGAYHQGLQQLDFGNEA